MRALTPASSSTASTSVMQAPDVKPQNASRRRLLGPTVKWSAVYFATSFALILYAQFVSGINHAEFGHFPDEPSHVMTSLLFRDYIAAHFPPPMAFAGNYYLHYPKIAIGVWPPLFYTIAGFWLLIFGTSHTSFLLFIAMIGATLVTTLSLFVRRVCGEWLGLCAGSLLVCLRPVHFGTTTMMVDMALAFLCLFSTLCLIRYFKTGQLIAALAFGLVTALALLTKGNALELILLVPLMCIATGQYRVLLRKDIYFAFVIIALVGLPWQLLSVHLLNNAALIESAGFFSRFTGYLAILWEQLGPVAILGFVVFLLSIVPRLGAQFDQHLPGAKYDVAGAGCLVIAVCLFHMIAPVPGPDGRYMIGALPPLIFLFMTGVTWMGGMLGSRRAWISYATAVLLVAFAMPSKAWIITRHDHLGMDDAARILHSSGKVILVDSEASGEGAFIVAMALLEQRPGHIIVRSSKVMSDNTWTPTEYKPLLRTPEEVRMLLDRIPVDSVLVDLTRTGWEADRARLLDAVRGAPSEWRLSSDLPASLSNSHHLQIYSRVQPSNNLTENEVLANVKAALARQPKVFSNGESAGTQKK